ncbi:PLAT domain-containing protein 2 [Cardamine amara subsp. amara]|uniref:PLAT domain-containing protein 2 n=1 Tax=Cardamine amara subsp. amara TaxID=228776 RepID=A0ABD1AFL4_CARAN
MGSGHNYNENGNLEIFTGKEKCLPSPICLLTLTSDGSGNKPGWYVDYVEVTTAKVGSVRTVQRFYVQQWLAIDESPYELTTERNNCGENQ